MTLRVIALTILLLAPPTDKAAVIHEQ